MDADLTVRQASLRDNVSPSSGHARERRLQRIEYLEGELIKAQAFIEDLDRYATHASQVQLVGHVVGPFMGHTIQSIRSKVVAQSQAMRDELALKREQV